MLTTRMLGMAFLADQNIGRPKFCWQRNFDRKRKNVYKELATQF